MHTQNDIHRINTASPVVYNILYGVTRGQLPQRAGLLGLNGGGKETKPILQLLGKHGTIHSFSLIPV